MPVCKSKLGECASKKLGGRMEGTKEGKISYFKQHNRLIGEHFLIL